MKLLGLLLPLALTSCTGSGSGIPPQTVTDVVSGVNLAICVFDNYATDMNAGMPPTAVIADVVAKCGTDAVTVANLLAAHKRASDAEARAAKK